MNFFAADNFYSDEYSNGFANTWYVLAFETKKTRDNYVNNSLKKATRAIKKSEIKDYIEAPKPFSGKSRVIATDRPNSDMPGCIGEVVVDYSDMGLKLN